VGGIGTALLGAGLSASSSPTPLLELLPRTVYVIPATLPPGQHDILVQAGNGRSAPLQMVLPAPTPGDPQDAIFYFRLP